MNSKFLSLSSLSSNHTEYSSEYFLNDVTTINLLLSGVDESTIPTTLEISWGDGVVEYYENSLYKDYKTESIFSEILYGKFSKLLSQQYSHVYYPSNSSLYKQLTAQIKMDYVDGSTSSWFVPIKIRSYDYFESIYDLKLIDTKILPITSNNKEFTFITDAGGFLVQMHS
jgi:hypothetical protein